VEPRVAPDNSDKTAGSSSLPNSNAVSLSGRQWLLVGAVMAALIVSAPALWKHAERFEPGTDYRVPYALGSDYWLYARHSRAVRHRQRIPLIGDSVVWGHYVPPDQTLSHHLNKTLGAARFANLGLDGTHPAALGGLTEYYAKEISGQAVVLHFNPLWITSAKHDLQTTKEFRFNHPELVPQFTMRIPCYKASSSRRLWAVAEHHVPFLVWTSHLRIAYFGGADLQRWTIENPYTNPAAVFAAGLPEPANAPPDEGSSWLDRGAKQRRVAWVDLDSSVQWRLFRNTVERVQARGSDVFVLVGPFNEHMLDDESAAVYARIKSQIGLWLQEANVPHLIPPALPSPLYADTSHPLAEGYALLARQLLDDPSFQSFAR